MWCSVCQSDVATEVGTDNRRVSCSNCGHLLAGAPGAAHEHAAVAAAPASGPETRAEEARQLLDRWAKGHFLDPYGPPKKTGIATEPAVPARLDAGQNAGRESRSPVAASTSMTSQETAVPAVGRSTQPAVFGETRGIETIDERTFIAASQQPDSRPGQPVKPSTPQSVVDSDGPRPTDDTATGESAVVKNQPEESATAPRLTEAESSAELDRLTREIMDRVSKITQARDAAANHEADVSPPNVNTTARSSAVETRSSASDLAASFPEPAEIGSRADDRQRDNKQNDGWRDDASSRRVETSAFQETPASTRSGVTHRMDAGHQANRQHDPPPSSAVASSTPAESAPSGWYNNIGQMLAYLGIIFLTAGTCGVIVSYFGGPASSVYAPYGWLGATIGQMLLFLGIVTLISAGMEQTSQELRQAVDQRMDEVTQRLDQIGSRIMRIEAANSDGPPRPHLLSQPEQERRHAESGTARSTRNGN
ncbi:MAG: hypothetical protein HQ518_21335 [Rhodopirellula sp.]|nr:hypothetical protein [Rhodopirellula sp.]